MRFEGLKRFFSSHKGKAVFGAGLIPVAYLAWRNRASIRKGVEGLRSLASRKPEDGVKRVRLSESRKTDMVNTVRFMLSKYDTDAYSIHYERNREKGFMGYHVRPNTGGRSLFFGWSETYQDRYPSMPFWIALDPAATKTFGERGMKIHYDIYPDPGDKASVLIPLTLDEMEDPRTAAGKIAELARKLLV